MANPCPDARIGARSFKTLRRWRRPVRSDGDHVGSDEMATVASKKCLNGQVESESPNSKAIDVRKVTDMIAKDSLLFAARTFILMSFALAIGSFDIQSTLAGGCGAYCKARTVRAICHDVVVAKGLTGRQRDSEFERCKVDPLTHRQIEEITDRAADLLD